MKTLYFNRQSLTGETKTNTSLEVQVGDDFALEMEVEKFDKLVQKVDENGEKLYYKEVFRTEEHEVVVGYDETLELTEMPCMVIVHVKDEEGNKLYTENIYDEEGNVVDTMTTTKSINETGEYNLPIEEELQKTSDSGKLLYLNEIIEIVYEEVLDHLEETLDRTELPIMLDTFKTIMVDVFINPEEFSVYEVIGKKYSHILEEHTQEDYIIADLFLDENDLDLEKSFANTGVGILNLPPKGYAVTKSIELEEASKLFKVISDTPEGISIYINTKKVINGAAELSNTTKSIKVKFSNTSDKHVDIKSYAITYAKEVI